jgi:hypothetical protein
MQMTCSGGRPERTLGLKNKREDVVSKKRLARAFKLCVALVGGLTVATTAWAQGSQHVRGTLTDVQDHALTIQTARGNTGTIKLADDAGLFLVEKSDVSAIKPGRFIGVTSVEQGGKREAREVHVFAESLRGLGEGHYPWDLDTGPNMMTNANVAQVQEVGQDRVLKLNYPGGEQTIAIPPNAEIVTFEKTTPDQLVAGRKVFVIVKKQKDGSDAASGVVVGANGIKPPM